VGGEASKSGFAPEEVSEAARRIAALAHLLPEGLMTVAPITANPADARPVFRRLRKLRDELRRSVPQGADGGWRQLSMGMTDDFEAAIAEGATIVRIGRALFGERPVPH
ncbi:MAG TPA: alanine racemase, partial [Ktedonobacterales bacterium]|nr:alanine racemase [Ktedonobacterales bacterium]